MVPAAHLVLVPGAGSDPVYWEALQTELTVRGQVSTAVDLPCEDADLLLEDYAAAVADVVRTLGDVPVTLVAHSFGAFTAGLVPDLVPVDHLVLVGPMPMEAISERFTASILCPRLFQSVQSRRK